MLLRHKDTRPLCCSIYNYALKPEVTADNYFGNFTNKKILVFNNSMVTI